ncbi:alpha/beta fold hydrolase [Amycolatopsis alkalitolerans]|uniref:Alpha/beta hydrolase n=1 Tax=Amycolatopsis alkalitolerans TaxID=2547244 RepID=A0A5C4LQ14_9PSEU|nr:alpha/beta hydrolase [Amycolatopsis alkalitolerans]TNC18716.1 alpha/beta hydrolase [Amycolatopsis alkalitolerans]
MRGYVDTRWGQLHFLATGSGEQTIVLLHETPLNHAAFQRLAPLLSEKFRVVAFDTPGYGESDSPAGPTTIEDYAKTFTEGLDAIGLDRIVLYGVHTGGRFGVHLAATLGARVEGLAPGGAPFYTDEVREAKVVPAIPAFADDSSHQLGIFEWEPAVYDPEARSRPVAGIAHDPRTGYQAFHAVYTYQPAKYLGKTTCPVLLLSHPDDPLFEPDNRFKAGVANARQVVVDVERLPV